MTANPQWPTFTFAQALARLPAHARAKFNALAAQADDATALLARAFEREKALLERRDGIARRFRYLDRATEQETIKDLQEEGEVIDAELSKITDERGKRDSTKANCEQVLAQLRGFIPVLIETPGGPLRPVTITAKPQDGETLVAAVTRVRNDIFSAQADLQRTRTAPPTTAEIKEQLRQHVQALVLSGSPTWHLDAGKVIVSWPDVQPFAAPGAALSAPSGSASRLLACLFPDEVFRLLCTGIEQITGGIASAERTRRVADLEATIIRLEHTEEALVTAAQAAGVVVHRRATASGYALLGLERTQAQEVAA